MPYFRKSHRFSALGAPEYVILRGAEELGSHLHFLSGGSLTGSSCRALGPGSRGAHLRAWKGVVLAFFRRTIATPKLPMARLFAICVVPTRSHLPI